MPSLSQGGRHRKAQALSLPRMSRDQNGETPEAFRKWEQKARSGTGKEVTSRIHCSMTKWESEKHISRCMPAEGFTGHVAIDGSLLGTAGKRGACGLVSGAVGL